MATIGLPGTGYSILYEYGIFRQKIVDGWQQELVDNWLPGGQVWLKSHPEQAVEVRFGGEIHESWDGSYHHVEQKNYDAVLAIPYDMYVSGYGSQGVSQLRLWAAKAPGIDMAAFNQGDYTSALRQNSTAELISKVLYPNDNHVEGKILRPAPAVLPLLRLDRRHRAAPSGTVRLDRESAREGCDPDQRYPPPPSLFRN